MLGAVQKLQDFLRAMDQWGQGHLEVENEECKNTGELVWIQLPVG